MNQMMLVILEGNFKRFTTAVKVKKKSALFLPHFTWSAIQTDPEGAVNSGLLPAVA